MEVKYRTSLNHNYMVIQAQEEKEESYELRMLTTNQITGCIPTQSRLVNGRTSLDYEITGALPLNVVYEKVGMTGEDIRCLIRTLMDAMRSCEQYLLSPGDLLLDPAYIYRREEGASILFACVPGHGEQDEESDNGLENLAEFVLKHLNHSDQEAVALGYEFYSCVGKREGCLEEELEEVLKVQRKPEENLQDRQMLQKLQKPQIESQTRQYSCQSDLVQPVAQVPVQERQQPQAHNWLSGSMDGGSFSGGETEEGNGAQCIRASVEQEEKKRRKTNLLFATADILICLVLGLCALLFLPVDLTQAGGIVFGLSAISFLTIRLFMNRDSRKQMKNHWAQGNEASDREEEALVRALRSELYREDEQARTVARFLDEPAEQKTTCLFLKDEEPEDVQLILKSAKDAGQEDILVTGDGGVIGKDILRADYLLNLPQISRVHARLKRQDEQWYLTDLNSRNGTGINGKKLMPMQEAALENGDAITFADLSFWAQIKDF